MYNIFNIYYYYDNGQKQELSMRVNMYIVSSSDS